MAPKEPFKVHSLSKHIEDTKKGLSAEAQYNKRPMGKPAVSIKREAGAIAKSIFGNNSDDEDSASSSGSSDEDGSDFLRKLAPQNAKATATAAQKKPARLDEIADSDEERRSAAKNGAASKQKGSVKTRESSPDDSSSESESDSDVESGLAKGEQEVKTNGVPRKAVAASSSSASSSGSESEEDENEDSSSDDSDSEGPTKAKTTKTNASSSSGESSDNDSASESEDEGEPEVVPKPKWAIKPTNGTSTTATSETSSSGEDSDSDEAADVEPNAIVKSKKSAPSESSEESSEESSGDEEDADASMHIVDRQQGRESAVPDFIAPDFVLRKGNDGSNGQDVASICSQANLQGKQVWYFTVPANVPISVIQNMEIPMNQSQRGDGIFSYDGEDYGISMDSMTPKSSIQILIPSPDGARYHSASRSIDQVMQVKKITQLGESSRNTSSAGPAPKRAPKPQPEGLKARYQPFGISSPMGQIGVDLSFQVENDTEMADAAALTTPSSSAQGKVEKKDKKKKQKEGEGKETETPRKGKRKHASSEDDAAAAAEQLKEENLSAETKSKKQKTHRGASPDLGSDAQSSTAASKKRTTLVVPTIPSSTPSSKSKSSKAKTETPVSKPRETAVPLPNVPGSSQPKVSPVPVPQQGVQSTPLTGKDEKRSKKKKTKASEATVDTQQSPPPSAQPSGRTNKTKVTPVPMPKLNMSG